MRRTVAAASCCHGATGVVALPALGRARIDRTSTPVDDVTLCRNVHTIKGNAGIYGLDSIAKLCHLLETRAAEAGVLAMREALPSLVSRWDAFANRVTPLVGSRSSEQLEISSSDLDSVASLARSSAPYTQIVEQVERLKLEPVRVRFSRIAMQATALADRLGKGPITVEIQDNAVRLPTGRFAHFWGAFIHAVRNSIDHGLEPRGARGDKPEHGKLILRAEMRTSGYVISLADDGHGIDWEAIRRKALARGIPAQTQEQLNEVLFMNGISSKDEVSAISGRGVGLGALRLASLALGGTLTIETRLGLGTALVFAFPHALPDGLIDVASLNARAVNANGNPARSQRQG